MIEQAESGRAFLVIAEELGMSLRDQRTTLMGLLAYLGEEDGVKDFRITNGKEDLTFTRTPSESLQTHEPTGVMDA